MGLSASPYCVFNFLKNKLNSSLDWAKSLHIEMYFVLKKNSYFPTKQLRLLFGPLTLTRRQAFFLSCIYVSFFVTFLFCFLSFSKILLSFLIFSYAFFLTFTFLSFLHLHLEISLSLIFCSLSYISLLFYFNLNVQFCFMSYISILLVCFLSYISFSFACNPYFILYFLS